MMKKTISMLMVLAFLLPWGAKGTRADEAQTAPSGPVGFWESLDNMRKLKSYQGKEAFSVTASFQDTSEKIIKGQLSLSVQATSKVDNKEGCLCDSESQVTAKLHVSLEGKDLPFTALDIGGRLSVVVLNQTEIDVRLEEATLKAENVSKEGQDDYQDFKKEFDDQMSLLKGKWIQIPLEVIESQNVDDLLQAQVESYRQYVLKDGLKEGLRKLAKDMVQMESERVGLSQVRRIKIEKMVDQFLDTAFFKVKPSTGASQDGMVSFQLDKGKVISFLRKLAQAAGHRLEAAELRKPGSFLAGLQWSGSYHEDAERGIMDQFKTTLGFRNLNFYFGLIEFPSLVFSYDWQVSHVNEPVTVKKPENAIPFEESPLKEMLEDGISPPQEPDFIPIPEPVEPNLPNKVSVDDDPSLGDPSAPVTIVEFVDFECPACGVVAKEVVPAIVSEYVKTGKARLVLRDFPLEYHTSSRAAAVAANCAREQGGDETYFQYADKILLNQGQLSSDSFTGWAADLGLSTRAFNRCLQSNEYDKEVEKDYQDGVSYGAEGAPTFFVNGLPLSVPGTGSRDWLEALSKSIDQELAQQRKPGASVVSPSQDVSAKDDPSLGDPSAPVTLVGFVDFQCPFCASFAKNTLPKIVSDYVEKGKVRVVLRDFPLSFHAEARPAALAANCVFEQAGGATYFKYAARLFENQDDLSASNFKKWAVEMGVDSASFSQCVEVEKYDEEINDDIADGTAQEVNGTPSFFVNDEEIVGAQPYSAFKTLIDKKLKEAGVK